MDIQTRKLAIIQEFLKVQSEEVISRIEKILKKERIASQQESLNPMSMEEFNDRIDQSMDDSKNGRLVDSDEVKLNIEKWS